MTDYLVPLDSAEWEVLREGLRQKAFRAGGVQVRLLEFTPGYADPSWCARGHAGTVLSGELEIEFAGSSVRFPAGSVLLIPPGPDHAHRARAPGGRALLLLVEEDEGA